MLYRFKMAAKQPIFVSCQFDFAQNLKNQFPNLAQNRRTWIEFYYWNNIF